MGQFTITGTMAKDNTVDITKQYTGAHAVIYKGNFTDRQLTGQWTIPSYNMQGDFQLNKAYEENDSHIPAPLPISAPVNSTYPSNDIWKGTYSQNGSQSPMTFTLFTA